MLNFKQETVLLRLNYIRKRGKMEWISGLKFIALQSTRIQTQAEREREERQFTILFGTFAVDKVILHVLSVI